MKRFVEIYQLAVLKAGGEKPLKEILPQTTSKKGLQATGDDRYLSSMTRCVFRAGFVWKVIDNKWPGFEAAFNQFNPLVVASYSDEKLEELAQDTRIVRNLSKIRATRDNAVFVLDVQKSHGSFGNLLAEWPQEDVVGLWLYLKQHGSRLGGNSGPMLLRLSGKDTFVLSNDVCAALVKHGFMKQLNPATKRDQLAAQDVFNHLHQESGRPLCELSKILALSVD